MIAELWTEDGSQILQPPQEMREIAGRAPASGWRRPHSRRVVKLHWAAIADDGSTAAAGHNGLVLAADGRVRRNYTSVDGA
jgi:hypothetical protein